MGLRLPYVKFLACSVVYCNTYEATRDFLHEYGLPMIEEDKFLKLRNTLFQGAKLSRVNSSTAKKILKNLNADDFIDTFYNGKENEAFLGALDIQANSFLRLALQVLLITKSEGEFKEHTGFELDTQTLDKFKEYFFNLEKMTWRDWLYYLSLLYRFSAQDAKALRYALQKNKTMALWVVGKVIPMDKNSLLNMISTLSYHEFRKHLENANTDAAVRFGRLCITALREMESLEKEEFITFIREAKEHQIPVFDRTKLK